MSKENSNFDSVISEIDFIKSKLLNSNYVINEDIEIKYSNVLESFYLVDESERDILYSKLRQMILNKKEAFEKFNSEKLNKISKSILVDDKIKASKQIWYYLYRTSIYNVKIFDSVIEKNKIIFKCAWLSFLFSKDDIDKIINTKFYLENKSKKQRVEIEVDWGKKSYFKYDYPHESLVSENDNFYLLININDLTEGDYRICYEFLGEEGKVIISNAAVSRKLEAIINKDNYNFKLIKFRVSYKEIYINIKIKEKSKLNLIKLKVDSLRYDIKLINRLKRDRLKLKFIYIFYKFIKILYKQKIVLLGEIPNTYEDSSSVLFEYLKNNKKKFNYFYVTTKKELINSDNRFIKFGSIKHKIIFLLADVVANVQNIDLYMNPFMERDNNFVAKREAEDTLLYLAFSKYLNKQKRIFLQHGVLYQSGLTNAIYINSDFDYLVVSTEFEKEVFPSRGRVFLESCLPRFSRYEKSNSSQKKILFSPTWRKYLKNINNGKLDIDIIRESEYYKKIIEVITSSEINNILKKYDYTMIYNVHHTLRGMIEEDLKYIKLPSNIYIKKEYESLNNLINECDLCITDYSSLFFDFLWQGKKVINYIFDYYDFHIRTDNNKKFNDYFNIKKFSGNIYVKNYYSLVETLKEVLDSNNNNNNNFIDFRKKIFFDVDDPCEFIIKIIENILRGEYYD